MTDHARPAPTIHFNVLHVLITSSVQAEDAFHHAPTDNILMLSRELAELVLQHVPPAALKDTVLLVQMIGLFRLEVNVFHAFIHVPLVVKICRDVTHAKADSLYQMENVSEAVQVEPDQLTEFARVQQDYSWMAPV